MARCPSSRARELVACCGPSLGQELVEAVVRPEIDEAELGKGVQCQRPQRIAGTPVGFNYASVLLPSLAIGLGVAFPVSFFIYGLVSASH
jgi:hypothetical protein